MIRDYLKIEDNEKKKTDKSSALMGLALLSACRKSDYEGNVCRQFVLVSLSHQRQSETQKYIPRGNLKQGTQKKGFDKGKSK